MDLYPTSSNLCCAGYCYSNTVCSCCRHCTKVFHINHQQNFGRRAAGPWQRLNRMHFEPTPIFLHCVRITVALLKHPATVYIFFTKDRKILFNKAEIACE